MADRLQKILSAAGIASRRKSEELIAQGRVMVNGVQAKVGDSADVGVDVVTVDGKPIAAQRKRYLVLNKPQGTVTTLDDPQGRPKVSDLINVPERLFPVGRLDYDTEGLLLLTNDGDFTQRITHPSYEIEKVYVARVATPIGLRALDLLRTGVQLEDGISAPAKVQIVYRDNRTVELTIHEGRNRMIRRMLAAVGSPVTGLIRTRIGSLNLGDLKTGAWRELSPDEVSGLSGRRAAT
ncbi:MAG: rRNA pseudouridine synthase [Chloroflexi bacterium]|jgi:23S rRNA pseudouridine2605 synthase|nr:rRNA pseudouridine synthase [Chloroflexota bacterium]MBT6681431.1 rRNA pseudouridine synthase [Chloroflexota bacterium]